MKTLLDEAGRIKLPLLVLTHLGVKPGDELTLEEEDGKWLIKSTRLPADILPDSAVDDLNWEDLDYHTVPLNRSRKLAVRFELRGRLEPMAHNLDEE